MRKNMRKVCLCASFFTCIVVGACAQANNLTTIQQGIKRCTEKIAHFSGLETERLLIRNFDEHDIDDVFVFTSDPYIVELTSIFDLMQTRDEAKLYVESMIQYSRNGIPCYWAIQEKATGKVIGLICIDIQSRTRGDLGYVVARDYWGRGIATEATKAVIDFGFKVLDLKRIEALCDPRNIASARVLEKCGMGYEGLLKSYYCVHGVMCDRKLYAITAENYEL